MSEQINGERNFSFIYRQLVENENDLVGHIAYSLYKSHKVDYIKGFISDHDRSPNETELESFHKSAEASINATKIHAQQILSIFIETVLKEQIEEIESNTLKNQHEILKEIIAPLKPKSWWSGFWMGVLQKAATAVVVGFIIFIVVFAASIGEKGFSKTIYDMFFNDSHKTEQTADPNNNIKQTR